MPIRTLALALLICATQAQAAPKKHKPTAAPAQDTTAAPADIDVDAMARAKDAAANTGTPADAAAQSAATEAPASPAASDTPKEDAAAASLPVDTAPATGKSATPEGSSTGVPLLLAPTPDEGQRRLGSACEARATALLDAAQKSDFASATSDFDAKMRTALPVPKFQQAWESLTQFGALTARGQTHLSMSDGYIAVTVPLLFEKANLYAQVACGSDGRIAGFYIKPLETPKQ